MWWLFGGSLVIFGFILLLAGLIIGPPTIPESIYHPDPNAGTQPVIDPRDVNTEGKARGLN